MNPGPNTITVIAYDNQDNHTTIVITIHLSEPDIFVNDDQHSYDFGSLTVGVTSDPYAFTVGNNGTGTLSVTSPSIIGADSSQFSIWSGGGSFTIDPGETHTIFVVFSPTSPGPKAATLRIPKNDPDENPWDISLTGTGTSDCIKPDPLCLTVPLMVHQNQSMRADGLGSNGTRYSMLQSITCKNLYLQRSIQSSMNLKHRERFFGLHPSTLHPRPTTIVSGE